MRKEMTLELIRSGWLRWAWWRPGTTWHFLSITTFAAIIARNNLVLKLGVVILVAGYHGRPEGVLWSVLRLKHQVRTRRGNFILTS